MDGGYFYNFYFQFPGNILQEKNKSFGLGTKSGGNRSYVMRETFLTSFLSIFVKKWTP